MDLIEEELNPGYNIQDPEFEFVVALGVSGSFSTLGGVSGSAGLVLGIDNEGIEVKTFISGTANASSPGTGIGVTASIIPGNSDPKVITESGNTIGGSVTIPTKLPSFGVYVGADISSYDTGETGLTLNIGVTPMAFPKTEGHISISSGTKLFGYDNDSDKYK